ncbi:hypothetical protein ACO2RV_07410 [Ancylobacter sp. VNQ12]|uniref:hypothetical protein n=1 Tax=Ancylobacter sp. VNQ12 TaxID=3400920 RepID=UPI003C094988
MTPKSPQNERLPNLSAARRRSPDDLCIFIMQYDYQLSIYDKSLLSSSAFPLAMLLYLGIFREAEALGMGSASTRFDSTGRRGSSSQGDEIR